MTDKIKERLEAGSMRLVKKWFWFEKIAGKTKTGYHGVIQIKLSDGTWYVYDWEKSDGLE